MNSAASGSLAASACGDRMTRRDGDEARAEDRVGPGREDLDIADRPPTGSARRKRNCRPRLLPIQFSCISRTLSGHWSSVVQALEQFIGEVGDLQEPLASLRRSTGAPERQPLPSITCSLASTVMSTGSQLTSLSLR